MEVKITDMQEFLTLVDEWRATGQCLTLTLDVEERRDQRRLKRFAVKSW